MAYAPAYRMMDSIVHQVCWFLLYLQHVLMRNLGAIVGPARSCRIYVNHSIRLQVRVP